MDCRICWVKRFQWTSLSADPHEIFCGGDMKTAPDRIFNSILGGETSLTLGRGDWKQQHDFNQVQDVL